MAARSETWRATLRDLKSCAANEDDAVWLGMRALARLPRDGSYDRALVARAYRRVIPYEPSLAAKFPDVYLPVALAELRRAARTDAVAALFVHYLGDARDAEAGARLRAANAWLCVARAADRTPRGRAKLAAAARDRDGVAAACAAVARHGLVHAVTSVLAHVGGDAAVDALVGGFARALERRDDELDHLATHLVPFARDARMRRLAAEVTAACAARAAEAPELALATRRWGVTVDRLALDVTVQSREVYQGLTRKLSAWIVLQSHAVPHAKAFVTWNKLNFDATRWEDGRLVVDEVRIGKPKDLDDLPRWLAAAARRRGVRWDRATVRVTSTLRGKARAAAVAWLLSELTG